ncbi:MAG: Fe-S cluster assembly protein SufD [Armatimonadetes bacterium]|nr:Fe-S cluster assembly protein SufD [Armatimonadota bacterium]
MSDHSTVQAPALAGFTREAVEALSARMGEPGWALEQRLAAFAAFEALPMPTVHDEGWRKTDLSGLRLGSLRPFAEPDGRAALPAQVSAWLEAAGARAGFLLQRDSLTVQRDLDGALRRKGVIFTDLDAAVREHAGLLREHLHTCVRPDEMKLHALHAAFRSGGTFLYVPRGVEVEVPLLSHAWIDTEGAAVFPHTLVLAESGSKVTLIDAYRSAEGQAQTLAVPVVELILRDGSTVRYVNHQDWSRHVWQVGVIRALLERDTTVNSLVIAFGAQLMRLGVEALLRGSGATSEMLGVFFGDRRQHYDFQTLQEHVATSTTSNLLYKGALTDQARSVFSGMIRAHYGAQKTNAFQINRNLILSEQAKADSMPKLEIMANDLRCTHGASVSRLDEEHIFYLRSRGLTRVQAVRMIVEGFFSDVLDRIPLPYIREALEREIAAKMRV